MDACAKRLIALELIKEEDGLLVPTRRGLERVQLANFPPSAIGSAMTENTRRYSIQIVDIAAGQDVLFTVVDWTDEEKRAAVAQVVRLVGVPEGASQDFIDMVAATQRANLNRMPRDSQDSAGAAHAAGLRGQTEQRGPRLHQVGASSGGYDDATLPPDVSL